MSFYLERINLFQNDFNVVQHQLKSDLTNYIVDFDVFLPHLG